MISWVKLRRSLSAASRSARRRSSGRFLSVSEAMAVTIRNQNDYQSRLAGNGSHHWGTSEELLWFHKDCASTSGTAEAWPAVNGADHRRPHARPVLEAILLEAFGRGAVTGHHRRCRSIRTSERTCATRLSRYVPRTTNRKEVRSRTSCSSPFCTGSTSQYSATRAFS